jgi:non-ribosomal peptide synthetase component E (peptide arylation enzyme)
LFDDLNFGDSNLFRISNFEVRISGLSGLGGHMYLEGFTPYKREDAEKYTKFRWWAGLTFGDMLDKAADIYPHKEAFVDGKSRLTFSQARKNVDRLAISMMEMGIKPLTRVLVQLPNWNEFVYGYLALQKIGAIPVLLIDRYRQHEINHLDCSGALQKNRLCPDYPRCFKKQSSHSKCHSCSGS